MNYDVGVTKRRTIISPDEAYFGVLTSSGAFTPASLPGLVLWLDASNGVQHSGANVTSWNDISGNGNHFTTVSGTPPTYSATGFNSLHPGVTMVAASGEFIEHATFPFNSAILSCFVVFTVTGNSILNDGFVSFAGAAGGGGDFNNANSFVIVSKGAGGNLLVFCNTVNDGGPFGIPATNTPLSVGLIFDGTGNGTTYSNFSPASPVSYPSGTLGSTTAVLTFGDRPSSGPTDYFDGTYGEIIITNQVISAPNLASLHSYWQTKWGVS